MAHDLDIDNDADHYNAICPECDADESDCRCDAGPHTCVFVGVSDGVGDEYDECEICERRVNESRHRDEWDIDWDGAV